MNSFNYTDAKFAAPGIFIITRNEEWLSQRSGHQTWVKHIKIEDEPAGEEVLNDTWKKQALHPSAFYRKSWLKEEQLINVLHER